MLRIIFTATLAAILVITFTACSGQPDQTSEPGAVQQLADTGAMIQEYPVPA